MKLMVLVIFILWMNQGYPNLISLSFFNFCSNNDEIYLNTRKRILSEKNPFYIKGKFGPGESSTHG